MTYTNWKVTDEQGVITVTADLDGSVNPALNIWVNRETGAVFVKGSPEFRVSDSNGHANSCVLSLFECLFSVYPNSIQVELDRDKKS